MDNLPLFTIPKWLPPNLPQELWAIIFHWKWKIEIRHIHTQLLKTNIYTFFSGQHIRNKYTGIPSIHIDVISVAIISAQKGYTRRHILKNMSYIWNEAQRDRERTQSNLERTQSNLERKQSNRERKQSNRERTQSNLERTQSNREKTQSDIERKQSDIERWQSDIERRQKDIERWQKDRERWQSDRERWQKDRERWQRDRKRRQREREVDY